MVTIDLCQAGKGGKSIWSHNKQDFIDPSPLGKSGVGPKNLSEFLKPFNSCIYKLYSFNLHFLYFYFILITEIPIFCRSFEVLISTDLQEISLPGKRTVF